MAKLVASFSVSIDGYGAGPAQHLEHPLGVGGLELHDWLFQTRTWRMMAGQVRGDAGGETGPDDDFAARGFADVGAWIIGRNIVRPRSRTLAG